MLRTRLIFLGLLALFVAGLIASNTAAASEHYYLVEGTEVGSSKTFEVEGSSGTSKIEGVFGGTKAVVRCAKDTYSGKDEEAGKSKGSIEYKECKAFSEKETTELKACKVNEPITAKFTGKLIGKEESETQEPVEEKLSPEGTEFTKLEITEKEKEVKCSEAGKLSLSGSQTCKLPTGEEEKTEHEIECTPSGSGKLKIGSEKASLTSTEKVKVKGDKDFAAVQKPNIRFTWLFNNNPLTGPKELTELAVTNKFTVSGTARSIEFLVECNTVESSAGGEIVNGVPGMVSNFVLTLRGCTTVKPTSCTASVPITTETLSGELAQGRFLSAGKDLIAFWSPGTPERRVLSITFTGTGCTLGTVYIVRALATAGVLAEIPGLQLPTQKLIFEPTEKFNYRSNTGASISSGLKVEGENSLVYLGGELVVKLSGGGEFGPS